MVARAVAAGRPQRLNLGTRVLVGPARTGNDERRWQYMIAGGAAGAGDGEADCGDERGEQHPDDVELGGRRQDRDRHGGEQRHGQRAGQLGGGRFGVVAAEGAAGDEPRREAEGEPVGERQSDRGAPHQREHADVPGVGPLGDGGQHTEQADGDVERHRVGLPPCLDGAGDGAAVVVRRAIDPRSAGGAPTPRPPR